MINTEGQLSGARCARFFMQKYAVYWPEGGAAIQYSVFIAWPENVND